MACSCEICELTAAKTMATAIAVDVETKASRLCLSTRMFKHTSSLFSEVEHDHDWFFSRFGGIVFQWIQFHAITKDPVRSGAVSQMVCPNNPTGGVAFLFRKSPTRYTVTFAYRIGSTSLRDADPSESTP